jgi:hypothetical protein
MTERKTKATADLSAAPALRALEGATILDALRTSYKQPLWVSPPFRTGQKAMRKDGHPGSVASHKL